MPVAGLTCYKYFDDLRMKTSDRDLPPAPPKTNTKHLSNTANNSKRRPKKFSRSSKAKKLRLGGNSAEIKDYLTKLQDLVPFVPKDRKCSKLEVIQGVIDYICHLQGALATHPAVAGSSGTTTTVVPECKVPYCQQRQELRAALLEAENEEPQDAQVPEVEHCHGPDSHRTTTLDQRAPTIFPAVGAQDA